MNQPRELMLLSKARRAISQATTLDEVKDIRDKAAAVTAYVKKAQMGQGLVVEAAAIKLRAERRLGELLQTLEFADSSLGNQYTGRVIADTDGDKPIFLRDLGVTKSDSSRSQRIASLPEETFEQYLSENINAQREPTISGLLRLAKAASVPADLSEQHEVQFANRDSLAALLEAGRRFPTIYADPPWPGRDSLDAEWRRTVDAIAAVPVARLCEENAHLHLWATTVSLPYAFRIVKAWGFTYRSCLVCLDPTVRGSEYWRDAQQFLLFATRGTLPFSGDPQPGWMQFEWPDDGRKPAAIHDLIETVSPGPYLDTFGTANRHDPAWHDGRITNQEHQSDDGETHVIEETHP